MGLMLEQASMIARLPKMDLIIRIWHSTLAASGLFFCQEREINQTTRANPMKIGDAKSRIFIHHVDMTAGLPKWDKHPRRRANLNRLKSQALVKKDGHELFFNFQ